MTATPTASPSPQVPGLGLQLDTTRLDLQYQNAYKKTELPDAYERLLLDVVNGEGSGAVGLGFGLRGRRGACVSKNNERTSQVGPCSSWLCYCATPAAAC